MIHLGERDCSVQRHHQKLIEESPSPAVSRSQRKKLMELTARAVKAIGYVGVGTWNSSWTGTDGSGSWR